MPVTQKPHICALKNDDCSGPLQRDHVGYSSPTQPEVIQWLCRYHNCMEARELRFFVAKEVLGFKLPGPARIALNELHVRYGLHPKLKKRIHEFSLEHPLSKNFRPGQGQKQADEAVADESDPEQVELTPDFRNRKIIGFWVKFEGRRRKLVH